LINSGLGKDMPPLPPFTLKKGWLELSDFSKALWNLVLAGTAAVYCDKVGRRPLFLISVAGMLCSYVVVMALSAGFSNTKHHALGIAVIPFLFM
jgi:hypothetical protein